jgi:hypothetical protein
MTARTWLREQMSAERSLEKRLTKCYMSCKLAQSKMGPDSPCMMVWGIVWAQDSASGAPSVAPQLVP